jgi:uracil-DNA glycosylase
MRILRADLLHPEWAQALEPAREAMIALDDFLVAEREAGREFLPSPDDIFRAFSLPVSTTRVVIVGQDPYPTPGHARGLAFSVGRDVRPLPRSLANIYRELADDSGVVTPAHGDLSAWCNQGVLVLNRVLTVQSGLANSHRGRGWEVITDTAMSALVTAAAPLVAILWGKDAARLRPLLGATPVIESAHPSPLSASRGFFGSRPFTRANEFLIEMGAEPVDWRVR